MKPPPPPPDEGEKILSQVKLAHFTASPAAIPPFGQSELSWAVTGPSEGFQVLLDGGAVARVGAMEASPSITNAYLLQASAYGDTKVLGETVVTIDTTSCGAVACSVPNLAEQIRRIAVGESLAADSDLAIASPGSVTFTPGQMTIELDFTSKVRAEGLKVAPDASVTITIICGFQVDPASGEMTTVDAGVTGSISEPWYIDLTPGLYQLILRWEEHEKQEQIPMDFQPLIDKLPSIVELFYPIKSEQRYHSVSIPGGSADPPIEIIACPYPAVS